MVGSNVTERLDKLDEFVDEYTHRMESVEDLSKNIHQAPIIYGRMGKRFDLNENLDVLELKKRVTDIEDGTISGADIDITAISLSNQPADASGDIDANSQKIVSLATCTDAGDATNKAYVDSLVSGSHGFTTITGITNDVVADVEKDTLTLATGNNILGIVGTTLTDTITFTIDETKIDHDVLTNVHQDVNTTASPEFVGLTISANSATITHSGTTSLTVASTNGTVIVEDVIFTGPAISTIANVDGANYIANTNSNSGSSAFAGFSASSDTSYIRISAFSSTYGGVFPGNSAIYTGNTNSLLIGTGGGNVIAMIVTHTTGIVVFNYGLTILDDKKAVFGTGSDGEIYVNADNLYIKNVTQDKDIVLGVDSGGSPLTITWDSDVDKLKHSAGTFDFDNDNLLTTGTLGCGNVTGGTYNALTLAAVTTGFTIAGGTTPKTLTCDDNFVVSTQLSAIGANTSKVTESTTVNAPLTISTYDISIPAATNAAAGHASAAHITAIEANTSHAGGDGSDHADVATNSTHVAGDGSDHADVASNTTHAGDSSQAHSDYLINNGNDSTSGTLQCTGLGVGVAPSEEMELGVSSAVGTFKAAVYSTTVTHYPQILFAKSRHATIGTLVETIDTDRIGSFDFYGVTSGSALAYGAQIKVIQNGAAGANFVPCDIHIEAYSATARNIDQLVIHNNGNIGLGCDVPNYQVTQEESTSGSCYYQFVNSTTGVTNADGTIIGLNPSEQFVIRNFEATHMIFYTSNVIQFEITSGGDCWVYNDSGVMFWGGGADFGMYYSGTHQFFKMYTGSGAFLFDTYSAIDQDNWILQIAGEGKDCIHEMWADEGDDNADKWRIIVDAATNHLKIQSYSGGSWSDAVDYAPVP